MAKIVNSHSYKGEFDFGNMTISEYDKKTEETTTYSLADALRRFDGLEISISFKQELTPTSADDADDSDEDEE
ncbi:hypothetical protein QB910_000013 [Dabrowskivirus KKP3916]|uniref:Bacillus phage SPbeta YonK domain-containing protein n=1 Tax=Alicyclobacillus phage KKP_3916 TaxID=3040651 RepID=A0AAT9V7F8_9CAUD|nr:hypothetical protein QB910_000013 [Alicyclobacillus phage KKP 3916]